MGSIKFQKTLAITSAQQRTQSNDFDVDLCNVTCHNSHRIQKLVTSLDENINNDKQQHQQQCFSIAQYVTRTSTEGHKRLRQMYLSRIDEPNKNIIEE